MTVSGANEVLLLSPFASLPETPVTDEVAKGWRTRLREAGCIWSVRPAAEVELSERGANSIDPVVVELVVPTEWLNQARIDWIEAHEGELRRLALEWFPIDIWSEMIEI